MSRVAVVTGGGSGMGRAICRQLAERGHRVSVLDIDGDAARAVAAEITGSGGTARAGVVDVSDRAAIEAALDDVRSALGPVEIMVTSAGIEGFAGFLDITPEVWDRMMAVNLTGTFHCAAGRSARHDRSQMGPHRHHLVVVGPVGDAEHVPLRGVQGRRHRLHQGARPRPGRHQITVNTIPPGVIDTPMMRRPIDAGTMNVDAVIARAPLGRLGTPEDIAAACVFLCSEEAGYITGQQINVNGGWYV